MQCIFQTCHENKSSVKTCLLYCVCVFAEARSSPLLQSSGAMTGRCRLGSQFHYQQQPAAQLLRKRMPRTNALAGEYRSIMTQVTGIRHSNLQFELVA